MPRKDLELAGKQTSVDYLQLRDLWASYLELLAGKVGSVVSCWVPASEVTSPPSLSYMPLST